MSAAIGNAQHPGARAQQQDAFGFSKLRDAEFVAHGGILAVVADGMGGLSHGDAASRAAVARFLDQYKQKTPDESIPDALLRAVHSANAAVVQVADDLNVRDELGTTLVAAVYTPGALHWISIGDSDLFLFREGALTRLNALHTYAAELDAQAATGAISREAALTDPQRESLTSHLGMPQLPLIDRSQRPLPLNEKDCILLASDGLSKFLPEPDLIRGLAGSLQQACDHLVATVIEQKADGQDNVTVVALAAGEVLAPPLERLVTQRGPQRPTLPRRRATPVVRAGAAVLIALAALAFGLRDKIPWPWSAPPVVAKPAKSPGNQRFDPSLDRPTVPRPEGDTTGAFDAAPPPIEAPEPPAAPAKKDPRR